MNSPYATGSVAFAANFYGRNQLITDLLNHRQTCIYLIGNRRAGKTSVLQRLAAKSEDVTLFIDLQRTGKKAANLSTVLTYQITRAIARGTELAERSGHLADLTEVQTQAIERAQQHAAILKKVTCGPNVDACAIIDSLADVAADHNLVVLMLWDEGEKLLEMKPSDLECLRSALQQRPELRTVLTATQRLGRWLGPYTRNTSPFLHGFARVYLPPLSDDEAIALICQHQNPAGQVEVSSSLCEQILDLTGRQPYLIQELCSRLFLAEGRLRPLEQADLLVDEALGDVFQTDYDGLSSSERTILKTLAKQPPLNLADLRLALPTIQPGVLDNDLFGLRQLGLIRSQAAGYEVSNVFLRAWLQAGRAVDALNGANDTMRDPRHQELADAYDQLRLITERKAEYVESTAIPLQLIKDERHWQTRIVELEQRLNGA